MRKLWKFTKISPNIKKRLLENDKCSTIKRIMAKFDGERGRFFLKWRVISKLSPNITIHWHYSSKNKIPNSFLQSRETLSSLFSTS